MSPADGGYESEGALSEIISSSSSPCCCCRCCCCKPVVSSIGATEVDSELLRGKLLIDSFEDCFFKGLGGTTIEIESTSRLKRVGAFLYTRQEQKCGNF